MITTAWIKCPRFFVIGRAGIDFYPTPAGSKIDQSLEFQAMLGGSSGNIAAGLARLGMGVELFTALPDDPVGRLTRQELDAFGIGQKYIADAPAQSRTTLALAENALHDHQALLYRHGASDLLIAQEDLTQVDLGEFGALVVTGTALSAEPSRGTTLSAMGKAQELGLCVVLDLDYRVAAWENVQIAQEQFEVAARLCDILVGNDVEFDVLAGTRSGLNYAAGYGTQKLAIYKMGELGTRVFAKGEEWFTPIFPVTPLKPVGAGDAFLSAMLAALGDQKPLHRAVVEGSASAAMVVTRPGCSHAMPTARELATFLMDHGS